MKPSIATLKQAFRVAHVSDLGPDTIRIIGEEVDPSFVDEENFNDLFEVRTTIEQLDHVLKNPDERASNSFTQEQYQNAFDELDSLTELGDFQYFSMNGNVPS